MVMICVMLGITSCATTRPSRCPEFPVLTGVNEILDFAQGDEDILNWIDLNGENIPLPIYKKLILTFQKHPAVEEDMDRLLKLWDKLDLRNN